MTSKYNGYFNANELYNESLLTLRNSHKDNYSQILEVYDYVAVNDPKMVAADMDIIVEKVTTVASLHEKGDYVDDCYVMMGKAQLLKQDYERAEETLLYFQEQFNPSNPYGRNFAKNKMSASDLKKLKEEERKEKIKEREEARKLKEEEKEKEIEAKEEAKKQRERERKEKDEARKKEREKQKKEREEARKNRKKRGNRSKKTEEKPAEEVNKEVSPQEEKVTEVNEEEAIVENKAPQSSTINNEKINEATGEPEEEEIDFEERIKQLKANEPKDETHYNEGLLLLAKTHTERQNYTSADFLLRRLDQTNYLKDEVRIAIPPAQARLMLAQKRYNEAIPYLEKGIEVADRDEDKARYAFIIAQIHQKNRDFDNAYLYFNKAKDYSKSFEMKFMALLNTYKNGLLSGKESRESVTKKIENLLGERKYNEFKDQIYFTLGELALESGDLVKALEYFELSNSNNKENGPLKAETYYLLADMYYNKQQYLNAKMYFDSTVLVMADKDVRKPLCQNYIDNLEDIARNIETLTYQDSMLYIASLSKEEQEKIAMKMLEEEKLSGKSDDQEQEKIGNLFTKNIKKGNLTRSNFFAYNITMRETGKKEFARKWGDRPLEDNWRRSNKLLNEGSEIKTNNEITSTEVESMPDATFKRLMKDVPFNIKQTETANQKIKQSLFDLGKLYRDRLENYEKSIASLETLNERFPNNEYQLDAYYYLYLSYLDINNAERADYYKSLILVKYPDSQYTKILTDPDYVNKLLADKDKEGKLYEATYALFQKDLHADVLKKTAIAEKQIDKDNPYMPKFLLLKAMSEGKINGKDEYILGLNAVITRYPNSPEERKAKEILRFLKGDSDAFSDVSVEEANKLFDLDDNKKHHVAIVVYGAGEMNFQEAKIAVSNYNKKYFKTDRLQLGESVLNKDVQIILVRSFPDKEKAMAYYKNVNAKKEEFLPSSLAESEVYPITQGNFTRLIRERQHDSYRVWFEENYLK